MFSDDGVWGTLVEKTKLRLVVIETRSNWDKGIETRGGWDNGKGPLKVN